MKFRKLLMTTAFLLAVASTFAFKAESKSKAKVFDFFSYVVGGTCYYQQGVLDQDDCHEEFTGAQCTYHLIPIYYRDIDGPLVPPTCILPLRRLN